MKRLPWIILVLALGIWSCRGGAAAKGCGGAGKAARGVDNFKAPVIKAPPLNSGALNTVDDFGAPVDRVGKAAIIDDAPGAAAAAEARPVAPPTKPARATQKASDGLDSLDVAGAAADGLESDDSESPRGR